MFKIGEHYLDTEEEKFETPLRAICPKCGKSIIRRVSKGTYYYTHCNRVWLK